VVFGFAVLVVLTVARFASNARTSRAFIVGKQCLQMLVHFVETLPMRLAANAALTTHKMKLNAKLPQVKELLLNMTLPSVKKRRDNYERAAANSFFSSVFVLNNVGLFFSPLGVFLEKLVPVKHQSHSQSMPARMSIKPAPDRREIKRF